MPAVTANDPSMLVDLDTETLILLSAPLLLLRLLLLPPFNAVSLCFSGDCDLLAED